MYNYVEMRAHVNSKIFLLRKFVDDLLHKVLGSSWVPLYTSVSFQRMRYRSVYELVLSLWEKHLFPFEESWGGRMIESSIKRDRWSVTVLHVMKSHVFSCHRIASSASHPSRHKIQKLSQRAIFDEAWLINGSLTLSKMGKWTQSFHIRWWIIPNISRWIFQWMHYQN